MQYSNLLFSMFLIILFSCNSNSNSNSNSKVTIEQSNLKILNDSIKIGDSIILEFTSEDNLFFYVKSNLLNKIYYPGIYNSLNIIFLNENHEILNDVKIIESNVHSNAINFNNIDCGENIPIEFISDNIIKIKGLDQNDFIKNTDEKIFCYIEYNSDINTIMKCSSNSYKHRLINGEIKAFMGSLKSNLVLFKL